MKAVIYSRVSTQEQELNNQLLPLRAWAKQKGLDLVGIYQEEESAWRVGHQKALKCLLDDAHKAKFQIVLVWALDRLSRQGVYAILALIDRLKRQGVQVLSYQEPWTEAPGILGDLLYAITGWVAEFESKRRSERTKEGLRRLKAMGKTLGRPLGAQDKKKRQKRTAKIHSQFLTPTGVI